ncbi:hypothetical protein ABID56_001268 [Alkalibacillus flavidus]|uniref:Uncharacterized protein n=1 Tax=Alkalibacillus flavidus TaxID=546021 RepID=A0ABV2KVR4_9BACI
MIADMYKRREKLGYILLAVLLLIIIGWSLFHPPKTTTQWLEMLFFLFPIGFIFSVIFISRSQYNKVKHFELPNSDQELLNLDHIVIKKDATFIPRLLLFEKNGRYIGMIKPIKIPSWLYPLIFYRDSFIEFIPLSFSFVTHDGKTQFTFHKKGWLKQVNLNITNQEQNDIGTYIQKELNALFHIKGQLFNEKEEPILSIKASGFSGNFSWKDEDGNQWAYFYNGKFPHEYTNVFRDIQNDIVELSDKLNEDDKTRLLAVIGYLFIARVKQ